jgi:hypothetical protein
MLPRGIAEHTGTIPAQRLGRWLQLRIGLAYGHAVFSPAWANLLGLRWEGKCKLPNGKKLAANGFWGVVKCES